jgi:hypothetical protein
MRANRFGQPWFEAAVEQSTKDWIRVDSWAVEQVCKAVDALASARDTYPELPLDDLTLALYEGYRNLCKVALWFSQSNEYNELLTELSFTEGGRAMREHFRSYLVPDIEEQASWSTGGQPSPSMPAADQKESPNIGGRLKHDNGIS